MSIKISRLDSSLPLPQYETSGSVGFDIYSRLDIEIPARSIGRIPSNLIIEVPVGYALIVASRSSTPKKHGLLTPHGIGIIDHDYHGPEDEILVQVYNFTDKPVKINRGTKVAQGLLIRVDKFEFEEVDKISEESRGGFGSTDK